MKLTKKYGQVRSNILMMSKLPTISHAYVVLAQEQRHQELSNMVHEVNESLAFNAEKRAYGDN